MNLPNFSGIPDAMDFVPYAVDYYNEVKELTISKFGQQATLLDSTHAMNLLGNVSFFEKFPDCYNIDQESLGILYQPYFKILDNDPIHDFMHGLSHIRSLSEHTLMGETMLTADEFYINSRGYPKITKEGQSVVLKLSDHVPWEHSPYIELKIPRQKLAQVDLLKKVIKRAKKNKPYLTSYPNDRYMCDFPDQDKLKIDFHKNPANSFEKRKGQNLIRAIYMDERYRAFSTTNTYFRDTPLKISSQESYSLVFIEDHEEDFIQNIHQTLVNSGVDELIKLNASIEAESNIYAPIVHETIQIIIKHFA